MPIELPDVLKVNVVLLGVALLSEQSQRDSFVDRIGSEVDPEAVVTGPILPLSAPGVPANAETGLVLHLRKDRIQIVSLPSRTLVEMDYPALDSLERLADVVGCAVELTDLERQTLTAFGFNIELAYRPTGEQSSGRYLAERLFPGQWFATEDLVPADGGGRLAFDGEGGRWTFIAEPRANDPSGHRVFLSLNLHKDSERTPDREEILKSLEQVWRRSSDFMTRLDEGPQS